MTTTTTNNEQDLRDILAQYDDPVGMICERLYNRFLGVSDFKNADVYLALEKVQPLSIDGRYYGDAAQFIADDIQLPYVTLRERVIELATVLQSWPHDGEAIIIYIRRIIDEAVGHIMDAGRE